MLRDGRWEGMNLLLAFFTLHCEKHTGLFCGLMCQLVMICGVSSKVCVLFNQIFVWYFSLVLPYWVSW